jgi:hypothetical protein
MAHQFPVDFNVPALDVDGKQINDAKGLPTTLGRTLADHLSRSPADKNLVKLYGWATTAARGEPVQMDTEDVAMLKAHIESLPLLTMGIKAQCVILLDKAARAADTVA